MRRFHECSIHVVAGVSTMARRRMAQPLCGRATPHHPRNGPAQRLIIVVNAYKSALKRCSFIRSHYNKLHLCLKNLACDDMARLPKLRTSFNKAIPIDLNDHHVNHTCNKLQ